MNAGRRFIFKRALMMLALTGLVCASTLHGQTKPYPDRAVRLVNSNPPGGPSDLVARALAEPFRTRFGHPLVVENRPGAGGNIGSELVAKSSPDGLTLLIVTDTVVTVNPHVYKKMGGDPARDLVPVALLAGFSQTLVCNSSVPAKSAAELVALAKNSRSTMRLAAPACQDIWRWSSSSRRPASTCTIYPTKAPPRLHRT